MEIIEKQVEKVKEVPYENGCYYGHKDINGKANAGLTLGIIGSALGAWNLFGANGFGFNRGRRVGLEGANININGNSGYGRNVYAPSAFEAWEKGCEDTLALQKGLYDWALVQQSQRFSDRQTINEEMFGIYKTTRDGFDIINANENKNSFALYKLQRDSNDALMKEISDLKSQVAVNTAIRPYQDKLIQCEIDKAFTAGVNYTDRKTCNVIYGEVVLPTVPEVKGYPSFNSCRCLAEAAPASASKPR